MTRVESRMERQRPATEVGPARETFPLIGYTATAGVKGQANGARRANGARKENGARGWYHSMKRRSRRTAVKGQTIML